MTTPADFNTESKPNWCPGCVLPGTIIHTNPDVKPIETLQVGDKVLGSDGRYHRVTETMVHRHKGKMYRITSKCFGNSVVTDDHPLLIAKREKIDVHNKTLDLVWERADKVIKGDYLAYPIPQEVVYTDEAELPQKLAKDSRSIELPGKIKVDGDFLRLCGYYIAEGWIDRRSAKKNKIDSAACFAFHIHEKNFVEDIARIVKERFGLSVKTKAKEKKSTIEVYINSARVARVFREWFGSGAQHKRIPHFMMLLPIDDQRELLKGLWRGDGWLHKNKARASYKTISAVLAEQIKLLLLRQGIVPTMLKEEPHGIHKNSWAIWVLGKRDFPKLQAILGMEAVKAVAGKSPSSLLNSRYAFIPVSNIEVFDYDGEVYNLEVEDEHSYVSENAILHNCGDFPILLTIKQSLAELPVQHEDIVLVSGIGCSSKLPYWVKTYGFSGLHGRPLPLATGIRLANHKLTVVAVGGDGDGYGEGMGHYIHAMRRNLDFTYVVHNNQVYGLTTGQYSPTSGHGFRSKSSPEGAIDEPVNPISLALAGGASFVARGFAGDPLHLRKLIVEGIKHKGFALIDVLQPCVTFNQVNTYEWFRARVYKLEEAGHDKANFQQALAKSFEWGDRIPIGIFWQHPRETYEEQLPQLGEEPMATRRIENIDVTPLMDELV